MKDEQYSLFDQLDKQKNNILSKIRELNLFIAGHKKCANIM